MILYLRLNRLTKPSFSGIQNKKQEIEIDSFAFVNWIAKILDLKTVIPKLIKDEIQDSLNNFDNVIKKDEMGRKHEKSVKK